MNEAVARFGRLDILVSNAAAPQGADRQDIAAVPARVWDQVIRVNLRATFLMSRFAAPVMRGQRYGRIINSSRGLPGVRVQRVPDRPDAGPRRWRGFPLLPSPGPAADPDSMSWRWQRRRLRRLQLTVTAGWQSSMKEKLT